MFCRVAGQKMLLLQEIFATSVVNLKLNSKCCNMYCKKTLCLQGDSSNTFPGKYFVWYKLYLIILPQAKIIIFEGIPYTPYPSSTDSPTPPPPKKKKIFSYFNLIAVYFCLLLFLKI